MDSIHVYQNTIVTFELIITFAHYTRIKRIFHSLAIASAKVKIYAIRIRL